MLDLSGCYVFVNQAFADALGFAPDELIGHAWGDMLHKDDLESVSMAYESMLTDGRSKLTCRVMHRSGTAVDVEMLLAKRRDSENVASGHYCFCRPLGISAAA
jgi:PAS domain S-box-containing protein